jgi:hypothetical protein
LGRRLACPIYYYYDGGWYQANIYGRNPRDVKKEGILRLPASEFPQLPASIARWLDDNGYTVPQSFIFRKPHNVVAGEFKLPGRIDWAVLASQDSETSSVIMFWNGSVDSTESLSTGPDSLCCDEYEYVSFVYAYGRYIHKIKPYELKMCCPDSTSWYANEIPPSISHCAIEDPFERYDEYIYYWHEGKLYIARAGD